MTFSTDLVWYLLSGMFAFNSLPHLISGIIGNKHMTPFGKDSSAVLNVGWGFLNLAFAVLILSLASGEIRPPSSPEGIGAFLVGGLVLSLMAASMFSNPNAKMPWWKS